MRASQSRPSTAVVPDCPEPAVDVESAAELERALDAAAPGEEPIYLCGGPGAVLDGGGTDAGMVLHLDGATHWSLIGFTFENGPKGNPTSARAAGDGFQTQ